MRNISLFDQARHYCATLYPGAKILFDQDLEVVKPFLHFLGQLLYKRRLRLQTMPDATGWIVVEDEPIETKLNEGDGIVACVVDRKPLDFQVTPEMVRMDNPFSDFGDDPTVSKPWQVCTKCNRAWTRCHHRGVLRFGEFDESAVMSKGGTA